MARLASLLGLDGNVPAAGDRSRELLAAALASGGDFAMVARECRMDLAARIEAHLGPFDPRHLRALHEVPRERFVRPEEVTHSAEDVPLPLDDRGLSTISAPHAYLLSFRLLELAEGDTVLELGTGTGYGAALAAAVVGPDGRVVSVEIDPELATRAAVLLADEANVRVLAQDAMAAGDLFVGARKVTCTFAVERLPAAWQDALEEGATLVAPVGAEGANQKLVRARRTAGALTTTEHGAVRYVPNRSAR